MQLSYFYLSAFGTLVRMISSMTVRTWAKASCWITSSPSNINRLARKPSTKKHVEDLFGRHITFKTMTRIIFIKTGSSEMNNILLLGQLKKLLCIFGKELLSAWSIDSNKALTLFFRLNRNWPLLVHKGRIAFSFLHLTIPSD